MPYLYEKTSHGGEDSIEITGYTGERKVLSIPETLEGLPVRSIGKHAFAGRRDLREVYLPSSLRVLKLFAFHNCPELRKLTLYNTVDDYYDGVIRQCDSLEEIEMYCDGSSYSLMKEMLADNDRAMSFDLHLPSEEIRLSFPDYALIASENTMARTIQFAYEGGGYQYRQCVRKKEIRYREYDRLFPFMEHDDPSFAAVIASDRLMYPHDLDRIAGDRYMNFLKEHADEALEQFAEAGQIERVRFVTDAGLADDESILRALRIASEKGETAICAVLVENGRKSRAEPAGMTLELEDW